MSDATSEPHATPPGEPTAVDVVNTAELAKTTHPIRGVLWGIVFGLGLVIVTIVTKVISLSLVPAVVVLVIGIALGTLWSLFGPAKAPAT